jgi:hypothetical protein
VEEAAGIREQIADTSYFQSPVPAQVEITDKAVEAVAKKLYRLSFGVTDTPWGHPKHESIRKRYRESARRLLAAALPYLVPRPLLDREAVQASARDLIYDRTTLTGHVDAVMELARPMPTEKQVKDVVLRHSLTSNRAYSLYELRLHHDELTAAVLSLLGGESA